VDGHDPAAVDAAIRQALVPCGKPTLICCKTVIGWGSPNMAGTHDVHGAALGAKEAAASKAALGWDGAPFEIPEPVAKAWSAKESGAASHAAWKRNFAAYQAEYPYEAAEFKRRVAGKLPEGYAAGIEAYLQKAAAAEAPMATRKSSQAAIEALAPLLPEFLGGSADLTGSNNTNWKAAKDVHGASPGNYLHYGVREFGMAALLNGVALHGGYIPFGGTFLVFSDYARNAMRLSALMRQRVIYVLTHDSIGLGEDGPTHQPVEHVSSLRIIPHMDVWRPADTLETAVAWKAAVERTDGPTSLILSRQNLVQHPGIDGRAEAAARGGYILRDSDGAPDLVLLATGSEVGLAIKAADLLAQRGTMVRVVSMPSTTVFDRQDAAYRRSVLPDGVRRAAVEAGVSDFWRKYVGLDGVVIGIDRFGESAPAPALFDLFGFTPEKVAAALAA
jgi:transketolase